MSQQSIQHPRHIEVAHTILEQLGSNRFMVMTGARNMTAGRQGLGSLTMTLPRGRYLRITLDASDTYTIEHFRIKRGTFERVELASEAGVYAEDLGQIFEKMTGLYTRL